MIETQREASAQIRFLCKVPSIVKFLRFQETATSQRCSPRSGQVRRPDYGLSVQATCAPQTSTIKVSHSIWNVNRKNARSGTRSQGGFTPPFSPRFHSCKQKRKSCPSCQSCLKTPFAPPLPARGKPRCTLAQKATFDAAHTPQPLATPIQTPTRHTRQTKRQAKTSLPRLGQAGNPPPPCRRQSTAIVGGGARRLQNKTPPLPCLAAPGPRAPFPFPPASPAARGDFLLNPPPAPGLPGATPSPCPSLLHPQPEADAPPSRLRCAARSRREAGVPEAEE